MAAFVIGRQLSCFCMPQSSCGGFRKYLSISGFPGTIQGCGVVVQWQVGGRKVWSAHFSHHPAPCRRPTATSYCYCSSAGHSMRAVEIGWRLMNDWRRSRTPWCPNAGAVQNSSSRWLRHSDSETCVLTLRRTTHRRRGMRTRRAKRKKMLLGEAVVASQSGAQTVFRPRFFYPRWHLIHACRRPETLTHCSSRTAPGRRFGCHRIAVAQFCDDIFPTWLTDACCFH